ncbi:plastidic glucose transporter 4 [Tanacetum coccineum]
MELNSRAISREVGIISQEFLEASIPPHLMVGTAKVSILVPNPVLDKTVQYIDTSMLLLSLSFTWKVLAQFSGPLVVIGTVLYVLSFSLGAGPIPALLLPEIFASRTREKVNALSLCMHWITNFFIGLCFLSVVAQFGISKVYLGFATICILAVIYIASKVVEIKGRLMKDIKRELSTPI